MGDDVCVIIPVYNEAEAIGETLRSVLKHARFVVCVVDGSSDGSAGIISGTTAHLVKHPINLGQGATIQTGIEYALQFPRVQYFVTYDADGQHDIKDAENMLKILRQKKLDIVLGSRFLGKTIGLKTGKKLFLKTAVWFTNHSSGLKLTDTHNGLRVFNRQVAENLNIAMPGFAHASEILDKVGRNKWKYEEAPVTISYTSYSTKKGQSMFNSINIMVELLFNRLGK